MSEHEAHLHAEGLRRGGSLVTVRADADAALRIEAMMAGRSAVPLETRAADYAATGWSRFEEDAPPYVVAPTNRVPPVM